MTRLEAGSCYSFNSHLFSLFQWHFLGVSLQTIQTGIKSRCEIGIILDEKYVRHPYSFPSFAGSLPCPVIGDICALYKDTSAPKTSVLKGQLGSIRFFCESLTEGQLRGI
jgi:hypothetical protein